MTAIETRGAPISPAGGCRGLRSIWTSQGARVDLPLVRRVLSARGYQGDAAEKSFLDPKLSELHDPCLMPGLEAAAVELLRALRAREPIVIYGDYDVDGISATAILFHTLHAIDPQARVSTYVPHRMEEGYGLNSAAMVELAKDHRVIVSVDCGVTAVEPARAAKAAGARLIITDHHTPPPPGEPLPDAVAIVHPGLARPDGSRYPFRDLCGAGVAYKLAWHLLQLACGSTGPGQRGAMPAQWRELLIQMLALASLGVIADVVPLVGENRVIARFGLSRLKESPLPGVRQLVEASGLAGENVGAEDVGFKLGPRLNACGRLGHARQAVELLTVASPDRAREIAAQLSTMNDARRETERCIADRATELAQSLGMTAPDRRAIVLADEGWHQGVVGICCSRLVQRFHRPTILLAVQGEGDDAVCHGSGRSVDGFSLHSALVNCKEHLLSFGGHDMAAGLKLRKRDLPAFVERFTHECNAGIREDDLTGRISYDCEADLKECTVEEVTRLERVGPFGRDNPKVRLRVNNATIAGEPGSMGRDGKHLQMLISQGPNPTARPMRVIGWDWCKVLSESGLVPRRGTSIDLVFIPKLNAWNGTVSVEADLCDLRVNTAQT